MKLIPLYQYESRILIGLRQDYSSPIVNDGLVVELDLEGKRIVNGPWSGQKKLKFGIYSPLSEDEKQSLIKTLGELFNEALLNEILTMLIMPPLDAVNSLIWIPDRLKGQEFK